MLFSKILSKTVSFISVPTLILIAITIQFMMNYSTGRFESANKPVGYEIYKFLPKIV